jgi:hypothetical protein
MVIMDTRNIAPDPCDNRLIRFSNFMQYLSCFCHILAAIDDSFDAIADLVDFAADIVFTIISTCMQAQVFFSSYPPIDTPAMLLFVLLPASNTHRRISFDDILP